MPGAGRAIAATLLALAAQPLITGPMLGALGFTAAGIQAGSMAASVQSLLGSVAARGLFATLQSAAMGGYGTLVVRTALQALAAMIEALGRCGHDAEAEDEDDLPAAASA